MKKSIQIPTALGLLETRFREVFISGNITKLIVIGLVFLIATVTIAKETKPPSGTVEINETQFGFIIGGSVGGGTLYFKGKQYPFKTGGLAVGGIGIAKVAAVGEVYNLTRVSQFPGTYVKGKIGFALGGGVGGLILKNEHGVVLRLESTLKGVALTLGAEGMTVKME
ncbi:MAG: DUF1134 domain-containing protein [Candidatus Dadabacteria bacterium]|nr:DUF1134 domain-containing protein [Candidatus Dadabacteria bacterium]